MSERTLYTVPEAAKILRVSKGYAYQLIKSGLLKGIKLGCMKVSVYAIEDFIKQNGGMDISNPYQVKTIA